jgi:hypothetical protein
MIAEDYADDLLQFDLLTVAGSDIVKVEFWSPEALQEAWDNLTAIPEPIIDCANFRIIDFRADNTVINPLPLAGQTVNLSALIMNETVKQVEWEVFVDNKSIQRGSGHAIEAVWNGRNAAGEVAPGNYTLVLAAKMINGGCIAEKIISATVEWIDECKLQITLTPQE